MAFRGVKCVRYAAKVTVGLILGMARLAGGRHESGRDPGIEPDDILGERGDGTIDFGPSDRVGTVEDLSVEIRDLDGVAIDDPQPTDAGPG